MRSAGSPAGPRGGGEAKLRAARDSFLPSRPAGRSGSSSRRPRGRGRCRGGRPSADSQSGSERDPLCRPRKAPPRPACAPRPRPPPPTARSTAVSISIALRSASADSCDSWDARFPSIVEAPLPRDPLRSALKRTGPPESPRAGEDAAPTKGCRDAFIIAAKGRRGGGHAAGEQAEDGRTFLGRAADPTRWSTVATTSALEKAGKEVSLGSRVSAPTKLKYEDGCRWLMFEMLQSVGGKGQAGEGADLSTPSTVDASALRRSGASESGAPGDLSRAPWRGMRSWRSASRLASDC